MRRIGGAAGTLERGLASVHIHDYLKLERQRGA